MPPPPSCTGHEPALDRAASQSGEHRGYGTTTVDAKCPPATVGINSMNAISKMSMRTIIPCPAAALRVGFFGAKRATATRPPLPASRGGAFVTFVAFCEYLASRVPGREQPASPERTYRRQRRPRSERRPTHEHKRRFRFPAAFCRAPLPAEEGRDRGRAACTAAIRELNTT